MAAGFRDRQEQNSKVRVDVHRLTKRWIDALEPVRKRVPAGPRDRVALIGLLPRGIGMRFVETALF